MPEPRIPERRVEFSPSTEICKQEANLFHDWPVTRIQAQKGSELTVIHGKLRDLT